jgi:hypothetical protein
MENIWKIALLGILAVREFFLVKSAYRLGVSLRDREK